MQDVPFSVEFDADTATITVVGEVDEPHAAALRDSIEHHGDNYATPLAINLSEVTYLPSVAVGVIATARQKAQRAGTEIDLVATEGSIAQRVLTVCALPHRTS